MSIERIKKNSFCISSSDTGHLLSLILFSFFIFFTQKTSASGIILFKKDAVVWGQQQTITGKLSGFILPTITVYHNDATLSVPVKKDSTFSFLLNLEDEHNEIFVAVQNENSTIASDTLHLTLGFHPLPVVKPYAVILQNRASLHAAVINNTTKKQLNFFWKDDPRNPVPVKIKNNNDSTSHFDLPTAEGIYYFNLLVTAGKDSAWFQTFITRRALNVSAFDMDKEYASWINDAIIYEITPGIFVKNGKYQNIQEKLAELKKLGVNTIWLQPVFETFGGGQGYDITNYFSLRFDLGKEVELKQLIQAAKALQMHVLFDFVPNHTSIHHPYAKDVIKYGTSSHYYNFYQHENDGVKYSSFYHKDENGFIYYFWKDLVNLNYQNEEVQQWMIEACKYWIKKFDIDGYRFDAVWGVNARCPLFAKRLKTELKSIKPDLLMLAEDKGSDKQVYELGFDLAYDWASDTSWVSQVSWQYRYDPKENYTLFNFPDSSKRAAMLREQLFQTDSFNHRRLRFIENNDLPRFITDHGLERTKMAAALLFSLPGVPLIYSGQEVGFQSPLYSDKPIFSAVASIQSLDHDGLFSYYSQLTRLRSSYSALRSKSLCEISVQSSTMAAFTRENKDQIFVIIVNPDSKPANAKFDLSRFTFLNDVKKNWQLLDVLTSDSFSIKNKVIIPMKGYSTRWLLFQNNSYVKNR